MDATCARLRASIGGGSVLCKQVSPVAGHVLKDAAHETTWSGLDGVLINEQGNPVDSGAVSVQ